ncbi:MAG TPA: DUF2249 domain-containing protein [Chitinophagaceae bacterium]|jgi:Domain of unknown function (DUF1858)./Uncharacterized conserved protein (DUF2249).
MIINSQTKIAALLKHHPDALEAIIKLSPDFKKLRNPVLRKLMAGRTTIAMASKIGGCKPEDFFEKLKPFGFEADDSKPVEEEKEDRPIPDFIKELDTSKVIPLDVRSMLAIGNDPLKLIQETVKSLQAGQVLKIINTFEPTPLVKLLEKQGFQSYTYFGEEDLVETYFYKTKAASSVQLEAVATESNDWDQLLKRFENKLQQTDVRHLEMPMPMMTILEALEKLPADTALYVHHKRIPVFLLTELKERNFDYRIKEVSEGEVFLLIFKN